MESRSDASLTDLPPVPLATAPLPRMALLLSILTLLLALVGVAIAVVLVREHLEVLGGNISQGLFCGAAAGNFDCSQVAAHPSSTFAGVPVALWGLLFYVAMTALALGSLLLTGPARTTVLFLGGSLAVAALVIDIGLAWVMVTQIGAICLNCVATYGANLLLAINLGTLALLEGGRPSWPALFSPTPLRAKLAMFAVLGVGWGFAVGLTAPAIRDLQDFSAYEVAEFRAQIEQPPDVDMAAFADQPSRGPVDATLVIVQSGDFECTFCRAMAVRLEQLRMLHRRDIRLVFLNSPVHPDCNPGIDEAVHDHACALGELAEAAAQLGRFWEYHDFVFTRIPIKAVTTENVVAHLADMGIDPEAARRALASGAPKAALEHDVELSNRYKLIMTPSLVLNGYGKRGGIYPASLGPIVEMMLAKAGVP